MLARTRPAQRPRFARLSIIARAGAILPIALVALGLASPAAHAAQAPDTWATIANFPAPADFSYAAAGGPDGKVYVAGGEPFPDNVLYAYDPASDTWSSSIMLNSMVMHPTMVEGQDGKIYIFDGWSTDVQVYDTTTGTVTNLAAMPSRHDTGAATVGHNGLIYVIGGYGSSGASAEMDVYDPTNNSWSSTVAPLPTGIEELAATTGPNGHIYAIGGYDGAGGNPLNTVYSYDPTLDAWTSMAPMATGRDGLQAATAPDGLIYAMGGYSLSSPESSVEVYDTVTNTWTAGTSMTSAHFRGAAATGLDGRIYVFLGATFTSEAYQPESAPVVTNVTATPASVVTGNGTTLTAHVTGDVTIASASYTINGGTAQPMTASDGTFDSTSEDVTATLPAFATAGTYHLCVTGTDIYGLPSGAVCTDLTVSVPTPVSGRGGLGPTTSAAPAHMLVASALVAPRTASVAPVTASVAHVASPQFVASARTAARAARAESTSASAGDLLPLVWFTLAALLLGGGCVALMRERRRSPLVR